MRQTIFGLVAAMAVVAASAAPAMACGETPCGQTYIPAPVYWGCNTGCGGWAYERLPDPVQQYGAAPVARPQYYYVDQGPTYSGPGNFAPYPTYQEGGFYGSGGNRHHHHHYGHHRAHYSYGPVLRRYY